MLLAGDSIALGLAAYLHATKVDAVVGRGSQAGVEAIAHDFAKRAVVDLGVNDDPRAPFAKAFVKRIPLVLDGRECVVWLTMRRHPAFNAALRNAALRDRRLVVVDGIVPTVDGTHPTVPGDRTLAARIRRALRRCPLI